MSTLPKDIMLDWQTRAVAAEKTVDVLKQKVLSLYKGRGGTSIYRELRQARKRAEQLQQKRRLMEIQAKALQKHNQELEQKVAKRTEELQVYVDKLEAEILERKRAEERIKIQQEQLYLLSTTDTLTGLHNRRYLYEIGRREFSKAKRYNRKFSIIIMDIDFFKKVNDTYGHDVGDITLEQVADICLSNQRESDLICRYGGEEFVLLLPESDASQAFVVAEQLRQAIASHVIQTRSASFQITCSLGIADYNNDDELDSILKRADQALYSAKKNGRNQSVISTKK